MNKSKLSLIGLLQALGVVVYCGLAAGLMLFLDKQYVVDTPLLFRMASVLTLIVFSAAVSGSIVFAYPAYLAVAKGKVKEALSVFLYTILCLLAIFAIVLIIGLALY